MWVKVLLLFFVFSFLFRTDFSFDQDLGRHIKLGEIILQTKSVPKVNLTSYTNPDFPFINTHWLFEVLTYLFYASNALQVLLFLKIIIFLVSVYLILKIVPKEKEIFLVIFGFIFLHVLRERLELRPEIFSFLFTAISYYILEKFLVKKTNWIYILPFIQLIWINTHIYFFVGFTLQIIFILHLAYLYFHKHLEIEKLKLLIMIFIASVVLSLLNPNGLAGLFYPLNVNQNYGYTIVENQTMFFLEGLNFKDPNFLYVKLGWAIIGIALLLNAFKKNLQLKNLFIAGFGFFLSYLNVRSFPYLVFLSLPAVLVNFPLEIKKPSFKTLVILITSSILLWESFSYLSGNYYLKNDKPDKVGLSFEQSVKGAMDFVIKNNLENPIFNNFDIGSYITFRGYPNYKVFVDGRPEAYPKDFFLNTYIPMQYDLDRFKKEDKKYNFKTIIFSHTDQTPWGANFIKNIIKEEDFKLVYLDDFMIVLVKKDQREDLKEVDLTKIAPKDFDFKDPTSYLRLAGFFFNIGDNLKGQQFVAELIRLNPKSTIGNNIFGNLNPGGF